jgi:RNA polymerase sigma-70 factor (ECF subfamily)
MSNAERNDTSLTLLEQLNRAGDEASWDRLVDLYSPLLRSWLLRYDVQPADADDLIQDVLLTVTKELSGFAHNQQTGAFRNWLRRIVVNRLRNFWRKRGRDVVGGSDLAHRLSELEEPQGELSQIWDREHNLHLVRQLFELIEPKFSDTTRTAFRRLTLDGATGDEVAQELGITLSAVFNAKSRVLRELRRLGKGLID